MTNEQHAVSAPGSTDLAEGSKLPSGQPLDRHPAAVYLGTLTSERSRRTMRGALETIAALLTGGAFDEKGRLTPGRETIESLAWSEIRYQHAAALRTVLVEHYSPSGANVVLSALRGVLREAWRLGLLSGEDLHRAIDVRNVKGERLPRGRALTRGELGALFSTCAADPSPAGRRDAALFAVLYGAGLRRSELVGLDVTDFNADDGAVRVRNGKGRKERIGYATNGAREALVAWMHIRGSAEGPLFVPIDKAGTLRVRRMTDQAIFAIVRKRASEARVSGFSPHDFRRTFVSELLDAGADLSTVQRLAGHARVSTTAIYDRRHEKVRRRAAELLHVPYASPRR